MLSPATIDLMSITGTTFETFGSVSVESRSSVFRSTYVVGPEEVVSSCGCRAQTTRSMFTHGLAVSRHSVLPAAHVVSPYTQALDAPMLVPATRCRMFDRIRLLCGPLNVLLE